MGSTNLPQAQVVWQIFSGDIGFGVYHLLNPNCTTKGHPFCPKVKTQKIIMCGLGSDLNLRLLDLESNILGRKPKHLIPVPFY